MVKQLKTYFAKICKGSVQKRDKRAFVLNISVNEAPHKGFVPIILVCVMGLAIYKSNVNIVLVVITLLIWD